MGTNHFQVKLYAEEMAITGVLMVIYVATGNGDKTSLPHTVAFTPLTPQTFNRPFLTCHSRESTGVIDNIKNDCIPFR